MGTAGSVIIDVCLCFGFCGVCGVCGVVVFAFPLPNFSHGYLLLLPPVLVFSFFFFSPDYSPDQLPLSDDVVIFTV